jgi:acetyl-CoA/propionyl-CoA carboxylase biotin carboxyl carrier protein
VAAQLRVAAGEPLGLTQDQVRVRGHAIECRVNAEDPARGFLPTSGTITTLRWPGGPGVRVDAGYETGDTVPAFYDDLLGKLVTWAPDRDRAIARMRAALDDLAVEGVASTVPALARILDAEDFRAASHWTTWLEEALDLGGLAPAATPEPEPDFQVTVGTRSWPVRLYRHRPHGAAGGAERGGLVASPLAGTLVKVEVAAGQRVAEGQLLAVVEAMKMETPLLAPFSGMVVGVRSQVGRPVAAGQTVVELQAAG